MPHLLGARLAESHTMAEAVAGEDPRIPVALDGIEIALDLAPTLPAVEGVAKLIRINLPCRACYDSQNERPARGIAFLDGEFRERGSKGQMQIRAQNPLHTFCRHRSLPRGMIARQAIRVANRDQIGLRAVRPDIPRGFRHSPATGSEVRVRQLPVIPQHLAARCESRIRPDRAQRSLAQRAEGRKTWQCVSEQKSNPCARWRPCQRSAQVRARMAIAARAAGALRVEASPLRTPET